MAQAASLVPDVASRIKVNDPIGGACFNILGFEEIPKGLRLSYESCKKVAAARGYLR